MLWITEEKVYKKLVKYTFTLGMLALCSCATTPHSEDSSALEKYNRTMFTINDKIDKAVIRPMAKGYRAITNKFVRQRVTDFFGNIHEPISAGNHILQGEFHDSAQNVGRFMINTVVGVAGLFDVASKVGLEKKGTGFDETLSVWCVSDGPYIILPIMGPSTLRAATGFAVDAYSSPTYWIIEENGDEEAMYAFYGAAGLKYLNMMADNLPLLESLEESSVDYYEALKSSYLQNRSKLKRCSYKPATETAPNYDFDMDDEEFDD